MELEVQSNGTTFSDEARGWLERVPQPYLIGYAIFAIKSKDGQEFTMGRGEVGERIRAAIRLTGRPDPDCRELKAQKKRGCAPLDGAHPCCLRSCPFESVLQEKTFQPRLFGSALGVIPDQSCTASRPFPARPVRPRPQHRPERACVERDDGTRPRRRR